MRTNHALHHLLDTTHALAGGIFNDIAYATSAVYHAAERGDKQTIQRLVKSGILDAVEFNLNAAVLSRESAQVIGTLLECGVPADTPDDYGGTPLIYAVIVGQRVEVVKVLLERADIDVNARDKDGQSALDYALGLWPPCNIAAILLEDGRVDYRKAAALNMLLDCERVDVNAEDEHHRSPLCNAARNGIARIVSSLLQRKDVNVNARCPLGMSALSHAIYSPHYFSRSKELRYVIALLLADPRVDVNLPDHELRTPLHLALRSGRWFILDMLLKHEGVEVNARDKDGFTPLGYAIHSWGCHNLVELLLEDVRVDFNLANNEGLTPLHMAVIKREVPLVRLLLAGGKVDTELVDGKGLKAEEYVVGAEELFEGVFEEQWIKVVFGWVMKRLCRSRRE
ncbi:ankyrin [Choiromyces venosus 120613-1]|uniref:Ankyrin n=1 Tax=Choiromyces venosus 120613-1 TaxID=1336337 RepID=A0A3N4JKK4_9PEZI|nr:ankyrin [Choiromyces venosus 120613-1]